MIFAGILVRVVFVANAVLIFGASLLAGGKINILVLIKVALATIDATGTIVAADKSLAIDSEGVHIIVVIVLIGRCSLDPFTLHGLKTTSILELVVGKVPNEDVILESFFEEARIGERLEAEVTLLGKACDKLFEGFVGGCEDLVVVQVRNDGKCV